MANSEHHENPILTRWLVHKWGEQKECPMCGGTEWAVSDNVLLLPLRDERMHSHLKRSLPLYVVTCETCGNTVLLNTQVIKRISTDELGGSRHA